jgi:FkbM family methyltransferase
MQRDLVVKKIVRPAYRVYMAFLVKWMSVNKKLVRGMPRGLFALSQFFEKWNEDYTNISLPEKNLKFITPNWLTKYRAETFFSKEPETLEWIRGFQEGETLWDIGANVGIFSLFAASQGTKVTAFEPSPLNLEILSRNILINDFENYITYVPLALGNKTGSTKIYMSRENFRVGGAHNSINLPKDQYGGVLEDPFEISVLTLTIDKCCEFFNLEKPTHIKIDVDGCELDVLQGARGVLTQVKSILVENYPQNKDSERVCEILLKSGLREKEIVKANSANQLWVRG